MIENPSIRGAFAQVWNYRARVFPLLLGLVAAEMGVMAVLTWAAPTFSRRFSLDPQDVGSIMGMGLMISGIVGPAGGGMLADSCQHTGVHRTMSALCALSLLSLLPGCLRLFRKQDWQACY